MTVRWKITQSFCLTLLMLLSLAAPLHARGQSESPSFHGFYVLSFDRYGGLANRYERDLAIEELQANRQVTRIIIISYGWANDGESSFATYLSLITDIRASVPEPAGPGTVAVFGVGWDSSQSGFRKLFNDVLPLPVVADALAIVPDTVLFPLSFWSKAAMADRIGYGGLRSTLNQIFGETYPEGTTHPEIYLIGHSFGTRVLSALMQDELAFFPVQAEEFISADHVKGAVMLQPALAADNLHRNARYPILTTQSRHDRANGLLYPIANLLVNSYSFTAVEALIQNRVFGAVEGTLAVASDRVTQTAGQVTDMVVPGRREDKREEEIPEPSRPDATDEKRGVLALFSGLPVRTYRATRRSSGELLSIPGAIAFSAVVTPISYGYGQVRGLLSNPIDHLMDTLAQIPVVEIPVDGLSHLVGREVPWGQRGKGFFNLGPINEAVGRMASPTVKGGEIPRSYSPEELQQIAAESTSCGLPRCEGIVSVDATDIISRGLFGDLNLPLIDYTVGWLDLIGAHGDYRNPKVVELMRLVINPPGGALTGSELRMEQ